MSLPTTPCPCADSTSAWQTWRDVRGVQLFRCEGCGIVCRDFSESDPAALYKDEYFCSDDDEFGYQDYLSMASSIRLNARKRLDRMAARGTSSGRLFEVGCAHGLFLDEARQRGFEVGGVEPAESAARYARETLGLDVQMGTDSQVRLEPCATDCLAMWDVIEHVAHPRELLARCHTWLKPGGLLVLSTGDVSALCSKISGERWHLFNFPEHLFFFTPRGLERILQTLGFKQVVVRYPWSRYTMSYLVERMRRKGRPRWFWRQLRLGPLHRLSLPVNLWDVMEVSARKPTA